ncbi:trypsin-like peptidase domain-containing protein [Nannocystis sp. ILAH1]|uniref:S1C family serine protease n=1 Tax=unclassified Nannocystis TaxID=2627009 RepID=UPI002270C7CB|nr:MULTISPECIES: trypsin-like peptidase domain-containing protein [unclassified Nannocystis]MCY0986020.1 trypsin-like peptidase domain-containing protein [Nannocystis sp. ILAH1]MCY1068616.1 trypsin-like peptidase domain-containing protein [Nannocystis sp. RBIL2]
MPTNAPGPEPRPARGESLWIAAGAAVLGVLLGGVAVLVGIQTAPPAASVPVDSPAPSVPVPALPPVAPPAACDCPEVRGDAGPSLVEAVERTRDAVVTLSGTDALGAGVLVDETGLVLTNYHVVAGQIRDPRQRVLGGVTDASAVAQPIRARFVDGRELPAELLVADRDRDIALLRLRPADSAERFAFATRGRSHELRVGETVFAVGTPFGLEHSVAQGIVAAIGRTGLLRSRQTPLLQLDAAINLGNSGGPIFNLRGQLVGITTATLERAQGIAFAIPIDHIAALLEALRAGHGARSGQVGAEVAPHGELDDDARALGYQNGLRVSRVLPGRSADAAGLRKDDLIVEAQGQRFDSFGTGPEAQLRLANHFVSTVRGLLPGEVLNLTVVRGKDRLSFNIPVAAAPPDQQVLIDADALLGLRLDESRREPIVKDLRPDAPISRSRGRELLRNARVSEIAGIPVESRDDLGPLLTELRQIGRFAAVQVGFVLADGRALRVRDFPVSPD